MDFDDLGFDEKEIEDFLEEKKRLKETYGPLFDEVAEILFRHDPIGINFETNTDEYEPEVETILPRLEGANSASELRRIVHEEFVRWFSADGVCDYLIGPEEKYEAIAREIWAAYLRHAN